MTGKEIRQTIRDANGKWVFFSDLISDDVSMNKILKAIMKDDHLRKSFSVSQDLTQIRYNGND